jgi:predicted amidohydrolase YtcJ
MRPTLLIRNAKIRTFDESQPIAQSLAILGERIVAVGSDKNLSRLVLSGTEVIDLGGRVVLPGLIDAHEHFSNFSQIALQLDLSPSRVKSAESILDLVRTEAKRLPEGEWIRGRGYDETKLEDGRMPTLEELDGAAPHHPVVLVHVSAHMAVLNSKALHRGGLDRNMPDPKGGAYIRYPGTSQLTGRLVGSAAFQFYSEPSSGGKQVVPPFERGIRKDALIRAARVLNEAGVTSVHDALVSPSYILSYHDTLFEHSLPLRVNMLIPHFWLSDLEALGLPGGWGNDWIRCTGIKVILDGAIAGGTAALRDGYSNDPKRHGLLMFDRQQELTKLVERIHRLGYQACIHANGDLAIDMALEAIESAQAEQPRPDPRHRIEHCTVVTAPILEKMRRLKVMAIPFGSYLWQHSEKILSYYGEKRAGMMFAHRSFLETDIQVAGGSDHPAGLHPPLLGVQCMVTRKTPSGHVLGEGQKISIEEAFKMYTVYAAHASFEENLKGKLAPARLADLIVLAEDPWTVDPEELRNIPVDLTIVGGRVVYKR